MMWHSLTSDQGGCSGMDAQLSPSAIPCAAALVALVINFFISLLSHMLALSHRQVIKLAK